MYTYNNNEFHGIVFSQLVKSRSGEVIAFIKNNLPGMLSEWLRRMLSQLKMFDPEFVALISRGLAKVLLGKKFRESTMSVMRKMKTWTTMEIYP